MDATRDLQGETALAVQPTIAVILPLLPAEEMPWPTIQHDPPFVKFWLGDEDVMNR